MSVHFPADNILQKPTHLLRIAVPILVQVDYDSTLTFGPVGGDNRVPQDPGRQRNPSVAASGAWSLSRPQCLP